MGSTALCLGVVQPPHLCPRRALVTPPLLAQLTLLTKGNFWKVSNSVFRQFFKLLVKFLVVHVSGFVVKQMERVCQGIGMV